MKRFIRIVSFVSIGLISFAAVAFASSEEVIENLKVEKILKVQVEKRGENYFMDINVMLINNHDRDLLLTKNTFDFYTCNSKEDRTCKELLESLQKDPSSDNANGSYIGNDVNYQKADIVLQQGKGNLVSFRVDLTADPSVALERTKDVLNFIGDPKPDDPNMKRTFFINGRFDLGIKTSQGWTYAEAIRVEWQFCPKFQEELPICNCTDDECLKKGDCPPQQSQQ